jgi:hypothetical protein
VEDIRRNDRSGIVIAVEFDDLERRTVPAFELSAPIGNATSASAARSPGALR